jgi:hypothetical protein
MDGVEFPFNQPGLEKKGMISMVRRFFFVKRKSTRY